MSVARLSIGRIAIYYVLPVLWITLFFRLMATVAEMMEVGCKLRMIHQMAAQI